MDAYIPHNEQLRELAEAPYVPSIEVTDALLDDIARCPRGVAETYGATPFDMVYSLASQQEVLEGRLELLCHVPKNVPASIGEYVKSTFVNRFWARLRANDENLMTSLLFRHQDDAVVDDRIFPMIERGKTGQASPAELMLLRNQLGTRSLEVACLSHPFGNDIEILKNMREAVKDGIHALGGEYNDLPEPCYAVKEVVYDENGMPTGVLMTRKLDFGVLPDDTIIRERSSFVLRLDDKSEIRAAIGDAGAAEIVRMSQLSKQEQKEAMIPFNAIISRYIAADAFDEIIPVSTTTYAFNREVEEALKLLNIEPKYDEYEPYAGPVEAELQKKLDEISAAYSHPIYKKF